MCLEAWFHPCAFAKGIGKRIQVKIVSPNSALICAAGLLAFVCLANLLLQWVAVFAWRLHYFPHSQNAFVSDLFQFYQSNGLSAFRSFSVFISPITTILFLSLAAQKYMNGKWAFDFHNVLTIQTPFCLLMPLLSEIGRTMNTIMNASGFGVIVFVGMAHWIIGYAAMARHLFELKWVIAVLIGIGCTVLLLLIQFVIVLSFNR
ncbi:hypothetical protein RAS2_21600 [Phycisphaerae bacterium RAS2]|nr:hypothetical protein RAS2_21600 [Phycisphaerae bacterium RAS2]